MARIVCGRTLYTENYVRQNSHGCLYESVREFIHIRTQIISKRRNDEDRVMGFVWIIQYKDSLKHCKFIEYMMKQDKSLRDLGLRVWETILLLHMLRASMTEELIIH